jgi:hypothetical protein
MRVRMFMAQFAPMVAKHGPDAKRQTIRPIPKRMPKVGDHESWRQWKGLPYRTPQVELAQVELTAVEPICIIACQVVIEGTTGLYSMSGDELAAFARADGFEGSVAFFKWFSDTHGLPFEGILIKAKDLVNPTHFSDQAV